MIYRYAEESKTFIQLVMGSKCSHNHTPAKLGSIRLLLEKICLFIKPPYLRYSGAYEFWGTSTGTYLTGTLTLDDQI
jgi:hypothetical protein